MAQLRTLVRTAHADQTRHLQDALESVHAAGGGEVVLTPGDYGYADNLVIRSGTTLRGQGGARLIALEAGRSSIFLQGDDITVADVALFGSASGRSASDRAMGFRAGGCARLTIIGCTIRGLASGGILVRDCEQVRISGNTIIGTRADGIHLTERTRHAIVSDNRLIETGDDGIACVGYRKDGDVVRHVTITGNLVTGGRARGIACLGAHHVSIVGNIISGTDAAGIYLAQEDNYDTYAPRHVALVGNVLTNVSRRVGHAGLFVRGGDGSRSTADGRRLIDRIDGVTLVGNLLDGSGHDGLFVGGHTRQVSARANVVGRAARRRMAAEDAGNDIEDVLPQ